LSVIFGILEGERLKWRGVKMRADDVAWIAEAVKSLDLQLITAESLRTVAM